MICQHLHHQIKKTKFFLQNNVTLDEAEESKEFKAFRKEVLRIIKKQISLLTQEDIDGVLQLVGGLAKAENTNAMSFLGTVFKPFRDLVNRALFTGFLIWSGDQGGKGAITRLGGDEDDFELTNKDITIALVRQGLARTKMYDNTTKKRIIQLVIQGRDMQLTNFEISELIAREFKTISQTRANIIAFNELADAVNLVEFETMKRNNVKRLRWVTVMDDRVCPICEPLHNKTVALGSNFVGDRDNKVVFTGPRPPAHVNCRCFLEEAIEGFSVRQERIIWVGQ